MSIELVLGLGNPGPRYAETRHNVGFRVVDELARRSGVGVWDRHPSCEIRPLATLGGVIGAKPLTFMNRSGNAAGWLIERYALDPERILVVVDDIDLPTGRLRLRKHGGPGTHNGLRDLCEEIGNGFPRLRVGVRGEEVWDDLAAYVTDPFGAHELEEVDRAIVRAADAVESVITDGLDAAMNRFNRFEVEPEDVNC
jgi:PTH1 family peptidyl-tRNA hydrolase